MGAERFIRAQVRTFGQQPGIHLLQQRTKAIGIVDQVLLTMPDNGELITEDVFTAGHHASEEAA